MSDVAQNGSGSRGPAAQVLVVDDDAGVRAAVVRALERRGHSATGAATCEDAMRCIAGREFDVAIVDVTLRRPGDGIDLLEQIKARATRTEVVVLSGNGSIEIATRSVRAGAFDFVEKPWKEERLLHTLDRAIEHRRLRDMTALYQAGRVIFHTRDFERLPAAIVEVSVDVMGADTVTLLLPGLDGAFYVAHAFGLDAEIVRTTRIALGEGVAGRVALSRTPLVIEGDASRYAGLQGVQSRTRVRSSIVYPLVVAEQVLGILTFNRLTEGSPFGAADLDKAAVLASQVLLALENGRLARQSATAEKLAAVGQLAAGIAHEINTPIQFVGDSLHFLKDAFADLVGVVGRLEQIVESMSTASPREDVQTLVFEARGLTAEIDLPYLTGAVPKAIERTVEGVDRVTGIVRAMKDFGRPESRARIAVDLNQCLRSTLVISSAEYKYVADVATHFEELRPVVCDAGELNQVFLNLIVNAGHAIAAAVSDSDRRGTITIRTRSQGDYAVIGIEDTGIGIPAHVQPRIFEPFFTTKPVGRGTGLGLSIARTIVEKHGGIMVFESEVGRGTRFSIRLPFEVSTP